MLDDVLDIPFEQLPFSTLSDFTNKAKYFHDDSKIKIDYDNRRLIINNATSNAELAVSGSIRATYFIGDGSQMTNLTGPGFNDEHSLNSDNGVHKDILFVDSTGNVGIHNTTPNARVHVKGNTVFRGVTNADFENYLVPSGSVLLWDPSRSAFRSGQYAGPINSNDVGSYSIGFGEDVVIKSLYSSVLGGENHLIDRSAISSVIVGGQDHSILNNYSVVLGGYRNLIGGEWSVIFGGREHNVYGDYNVVLGGDLNEVRGALNTVIGRQNVMVGDYSVAIGSNHTVSSNFSVALGQNAQANNYYSIIYSDGESSMATKKSQQFIVSSAKGVGLNIAPQSGFALTVSGNIQANKYYGDGRYVRNIIAAQDYWKQSALPQGIYYIHGPVSVGTISSHANLTVSGGITIQEPNQASNGTLGFTDQNGLRFYHNDWISVDQIDVDTTLSAGWGIQLDDKTFSLAPMGADINNVIYYNGSRWAPKDTFVWKPYSNGHYLPKQWALFDDQQSSSIKSALVIQSPPSGTITPYPLVIGLTDSLVFSPNDNTIFFNLDYKDSNKTSFQILDPLNNRLGDTYGGVIQIKDNAFRIKQTVDPGNSQDLVQMKSLLNLSPTSIYIHEDVPQATFDGKGSIGFIHTFADKNNVGFGHKLNMWNKFSNYFYYDQGSNVNFFAGNDAISQPIQFKINGQDKLVFTENGEMIVGDGETPYAKLSIFGGGLAFNVKDTLIEGTMKSGKWTSVQSVSADDPSIHINVNNDVVADIGHMSMGIGTKNSSLISLLAFSEVSPNVNLRSLSNANLRLQNSASNTLITNQNGSFILKDESSSQPFIMMDGSQHLNLLTSTFSTRPTSEIVIDSDIELSNFDSIVFKSENKSPLVSISKSVNKVMVKQLGVNPIRFQSANGKDLMAIDSSRKVSIGSLDTTDNAQIYVSGDVLFDDSIYYQHGGSQKLVQAFVVDKSSINSADELEVRSIKTLLIDEESGLILSVLNEDEVEISAPGYYKKMVETPTYDGVDLDPLNDPFYVEANGKDIIEFKEVYPNGGVSINMLDTNSDGVGDSIELYNPLIDGGLIEGDITLNGRLEVYGINANGSRVSNIPFQWIKKNNNLYYSSGNVGINTASPNYVLDVLDVMHTEQLDVSDKLIAKAIVFDDSTATTVNQTITFGVDDNNDDASDRIGFNSTNGSLITMLAQGNNQTIGVFNDTPQTDLHVKQVDANASLLFESEPSGKSGVILKSSASNTGALFQVNKSTDDNPSGGAPNESVFIASENIIIHTNTDPAVYVKDTYVSINKDLDKNVFYADNTVTIGDEFAGSVLHSDQGLTIQEKLFVGHTGAVPPGASLHKRSPNGR